MNAEFAKALTEALAEMKNPELSGLAKVPTKSGGEYSYKYARLPEILNAAREIFAKHNLSIQQDVSSDNGSVSVKTVVLHSSGETLESSTLSLSSGGSPQAAGSAITYARRYQLTAFLGIAGEEDDDGTAAQHSEEAPTTQNKSAPKPGCINEAQAKLLYVWIKKAGISDVSIKQKYGVEHTADFTKNQMDDIKAHLVETGRLVFREDPDGKERAYSPEEIAAEEAIPDDLPA